MEAYASQDEVVKALRTRCCELAAESRVLLDGLGTLQNVGLDKQAAEVRSRLARLGALEEFLHGAAEDHSECGRASVVVECIEGHTSLRPFTCGRSAICPKCAQVEAAKRKAVYERRAIEQLNRARSSHRPKLLTLSLKPLDGELRSDSFERCQLSFRALYRIMWDVPKGRREWRVYWELYPLRDAEIERTPLSTPVGNLRKPGAREREARKARRRKVVAGAALKKRGAVCAYEFGSKGGKVHAHALLICEFVNWNRLTLCWWLLTGNSHVADIRAADRDALGEVLKYPQKFTNRSPRELVEFYEAMLTYGKRQHRPRDPDCPSVELVVASARRRVEAYGCLRSRSRRLRAISCRACARLAADQLVLWVSFRALCAVWV